MTNDQIIASATVHDAEPNPLAFKNPYGKESSLLRHGYEPSYAKKQKKQVTNFTKPKKKRKWPILSQLKPFQPYALFARIECRLCVRLEPRPYLVPTAEKKSKYRKHLKKIKNMNDEVLGHLREARAILNDELPKSRESAIVIAKIEEAILWRQENLRLRQPAINEEQKKPD